jgi:hypothetical protein
MGEQINRTLPHRQARRAAATPRAPAQDLPIPPATFEALVRMSRDGYLGPDETDADPDSHPEHEGSHHEHDAGEGSHPEHDAREGSHHERDPWRDSDPMHAGDPGGRQPGAEHRPDARPAEPSWLSVIATTARLWLRRHLQPTSRAGRRRFWMIAMTAVVFAVLTAGAVTAELVRQTTAAPTTGAPARGSGAHSGAISAAASTSRRAASWVAQQVSKDAIVACDPGMCPLLHARGVPAQNLLVLRSAAADPLGSDVVVATQAVRNGLGNRLRLVYAPTVIASFGSGTSRIDILAVAPDGATAYEAALGTDKTARRNAGVELASNPRIHLAATARRELTAGQVDSRLLITLATLATTRQVNVVAFSGYAPGATAGVPLRVVDIADTAGNAEFRAIRAFVLAQRPPFVPARLGSVRLANGETVIRVQFGAPSPLGLLNAHGTQ